MILSSPADPMGMMAGMCALAEDDTLDQAKVSALQQIADTLADIRALLVKQQQADAAESEKENLLTADCMPVYTFKIERNAMDKIVSMTAEAK
jgi:hypothetical protein